MPYKGLTLVRKKRRRRWRLKEFIAAPDLDALLNDSEHLD
jgi:hypothetical protein